MGLDLVDLVGGVEGILTVTDRATRLLLVGGVKEYLAAVEEEYLRDITVGVDLDWF
jgi:hypothetical protein